MKRSPLIRPQPEARAAVPILRPRKCKSCGERYRPLRPMQQACGTACAIKLGAIKTAKAQAKADKAKRQQLQPRSYWVEQAQRAVNEFVRTRDAHQPCISCGTTSADVWHAGHYYSTAARPDLRFDTANIHRQCAQCNLFKHGNLIEYRRNLPARIGQVELDRIDGPATNPRATVQVLQELVKEFRSRTKELGQ